MPNLTKDLYVVLNTICKTNYDPYTFPNVCNGQVATDADRAKQSAFDKAVAKLSEEIGGEHSAAGSETTVGELRNYFINLKNKSPGEVKTVSKEVGELIDGLTDLVTHGYGDEVALDLYWSAGSHIDKEKGLVKDEGEYLAHVNSLNELYRIALQK